MAFAIYRRVHPAPNRSRRNSTHPSSAFSIRTTIRPSGRRGEGTDGDRASQTGAASFLPVDTPLLADILRESITDLTADDYSETQQQAWITRAIDDMEAFAKRLGSQLTLIATLQGSPVGFASLAGGGTIDLLYVHPVAAGQGVGNMLTDALEKLAGARGATKLIVDASDTARGFSKSAAMSRSSATQSRSATNGWPIRPCTSNSRPNRRRHDQATRNAISASLEILHRLEIRGDDRRRPARALCCHAFGLRFSEMSRERLYLFDTTLRDGAQTNGVDFTLADKLAIAAMLDDLGIDYIEGGYPGANPTDTELYAADRGLKAKFTAFGMTRRPGRSASNDPGLAALLDAKADAICFVAKASEYQVRVALETTRKKTRLDPRRRERGQG